MRYRLVHATALGGALVLGACAASQELARIPSANANQQATASQQRPAVAAAGRLSPATGQGTLRISIRWPQRPPYAIQLLPDNTNSVQIKVSNASDSVVAVTTLSRPSGTQQTNASLAVPAGPQLLTANAYQEQTPGFGSIPIATATESIVVIPSAVVAATLSLVPAFMPTLTGMPANGAPGAVITVTGTNFTGNPVVVFGGGATSSSVTPNWTGTQLNVAIPAGAQDGPIAVLTDGLTGTSSSSFAVLAGIALTPISTASSQDVTVDFVATATDTANASVTSPIVSWTYVQTQGLVSPAMSAQSTMSATGAFTAGATGTYEIDATAGNLKGSASITVN